MTEFDQTKEDILGALGEYKPLIETLPSKIKAKLFEGLQDLKKAGVVEYGRRFIDSKGKSCMFTTSKKWHDASKSKDLQACMQTHMSAELLQVKRSNLTTLTRSADKMSSQYLKTLHELGLNNGVVRYYFYKDHVEISYFVAPSEENFARDLLLNKITLLENAEKKIMPAITVLKASNVTKGKEQKVVEPGVMNVLIDKRLKRNYEAQLDIGSCPFEFTYKDLAYLALLRFECTNSCIARWFGVSESTVKHDLCNLKIKFSLETKEDLVALARHPKVVQAVKIMDII